MWAPATNGQNYKLLTKTGGGGLPLDSRSKRETPVIALVNNYTRVEPPGSTELSSTDEQTTSPTSSKCSIPCGHRRCWTVDIESSDTDQALTAPPSRCSLPCGHTRCWKVKEVGVTVEVEPVPQPVRVSQACDAGGSVVRNSEECKQFLDGECSHGISGKQNGGCQKFHKKLCLKFMKWGDKQELGCKNTVCSRALPNVCPSSILYLKCMDMNSNFMLKSVSVKRNQQLVSLSQAYVQVLGRHLTSQCGVNVIILMFWVFPT